MTVCMPFTKLIFTASEGAYPTAISNASLSLGAGSTTGGVGHATAGARMGGPEVQEGRIRHAGEEARVALEVQAAFEALWGGEVPCETEGGMGLTSLPLRHTCTPLPPRMPAMSTTRRL